MRYLGKNEKKAWITEDVLDLRKERRYEAEVAKVYRGANKRIQKAEKKAKKDWIRVQCADGQNTARNITPMKFMVTMQF